MLFTKGQKIFAIVFVISFIVMLILAYRSDAKIHKTYYKNVWVVLLSILFILAALVVILKALPAIKQAIPL